MYRRPKWAREARITMMDRGLKNKKVAQDLGLSPQHLSNIMTGYHQTGESTARRICDYLGIPYVPEDPAGKDSTAGSEAV